MMICTYTFRNPILLEQALDPQISRLQFQRFEIRGDAILGLVIIDALMFLFPNENEGALSKRRANLVSREMCNIVGNCMGLVHSSGHPADMVEAIIGAIYEDSSKNIEACRKWIMELWNPHLAVEKERTSPLIDSKTMLQEYAQSRRLPPPVYEEVSRVGPDHDLMLTVKVSIIGHGYCIGVGRTKKSAEKEAASEMIERIRIESNERLRQTMKPLGIPPLGFEFPAPT